MPTRRLLLLSYEAIRAVGCKVWLLFTGLVCSWATFAPVQSLVQQASSNKNQQIQQAQGTVTQPIWGPQSSDNLYFQCNGKSSEKTKSCFDVPIGEKINELIPVRDVSESEKITLRTHWQKVLPPASQPSDEKQIQWRKLALTEVPWRPARPHSKDASPTTNDWILAKWTSIGLMLIADQYSIGIQIPPDGHIDFNYPSAVVSEPGARNIVARFDKQPMFNILTKVFAISWNSVDDFDVYCDPSPFREANLSIMSKSHSEPAEPSASNWFGHFVIELRGNEPQVLRVRAEQ